MSKQTYHGRYQHRKAAIVVCLFFCALLVLFTVACQPGKAAVVLTPIPVEQETSDETDQNEVPIDTTASPELVNAENLWNPAKELLNSASTLPGAIPVSVSHISQPPETLPAGIKVLVDADVVVPQTENYNIRECNLSSFTLEDYRSMFDYFLPNPAVITHQITNITQAEGTVVLNDDDITQGASFFVEQGNETFSLQLGGKYSIFWLEHTDEVIYCEGYLVGDEEWEKEIGEIIREPIALTREEAQSQADRMISDLNIQGWQIDSVQRAAAFDMNSPTSKVLGRGWMLFYGLSNDELTMFSDKGYSSNKNDRLSYWQADAGKLTIYVDERGVTDFHWEKHYTPSSVTYPVASIISAEEALKLAKERIARIYGELDYENTQIEIYDIRLSTMLIGYSDQLTGQPFPDPYEDIALLIPTWNFAFRIIFPYGDTEYYMMPFSATDGGAISMLYF
ncbi:MAG: hypothetical protein CVV04_08745 [Firmicutes bacterium HGW-Firmicutes-9]|jgi:hypothetical protein|nr:MAG: hypothetical protein CVV04_08745 [Firmicutes bacterium HGW-Firmicutes-9]